jgi:hypothetical protein
MSSPDAHVASPLTDGSPAPRSLPPGSTGGDSHVGSLCEGLPAYFVDPPIEAVVFAWGVNEDGQLGLERVTGSAAANNVLVPKVVEACLGECRLLLVCLAQAIAFGWQLHDRWQASCCITPCSGCTHPLFLQALVFAAASMAAPR